MQDNISSGRAGEGMLMLQQQHNPAAAAAISGGDQNELLDKLDCGVKILSGRDWPGTWPQAPVQPANTQWCVMQSLLDANSTGALGDTPVAHLLGSRLPSAFIAVVLWCPMKGPGPWIMTHTWSAPGGYDRMTG
jgi:hypothetical protein